MREILFRGKCKGNLCEWLEGYLFEYDSPKLSYILGELDFRESIYDIWKCAEEVIPCTVGQFTGYNDKNGKKIFEGDIFHFEDDIIAVVIFKDGGFRLEEYGLCGTWTESGYDECGGGWGVLDSSPIDWYSLIDLEVIGNIYDNKDILEGKNVFP